MAEHLAVVEFASLEMAQAWLRRYGEDGDRLVLKWLGASMYHKAMIENLAAGLGLTVVVEVQGR